MNIGSILIIARFLGLLVAFHMFCLAIFFYCKRSSKKQEYFVLGTVMLLSSCVVFVRILTSLGMVSVKSIIRVIDINYLFLIIYPLLFLYLKLLLQKGLFLELKKVIKHFVVFFVVVLLGLSSFSLSYKGMGVLLLVHNTVYILIGYQLIQKEKNDKNSREVKWANYLILGFSIFLFTRLLSWVALEVVKHKNLCVITNGAYILIVFSLIYILMFFLIEPKKITSDEVKYKKSSLSEDDEVFIFQRIKEYLEMEKPYLENDFSLLSFSENINIAPKIISQSINSKSNSNFNDFINKYRLKESADLLINKSKKELSISEIYYAVGFNSKSTFNTLFKKTHGMTPSEYRKRSFS